MAAYDKWVDWVATRLKSARTRADQGFSGSVCARFAALAIPSRRPRPRRRRTLQAQTEATPQKVAARLKQLEADGLVERRPYRERPLRHEYHLTEKGEAFYPVILALRAWGESWCKSPGEGLAMRYTHRTCGQPAGLGPLCESCGEPLLRKDLSAEPSPAYADEREDRAKRFKGD